MRIMVVDDEPSTREATAASLSGRGWAPTAVASGRIALDTHAKECFDLIIMDVHMPGMDGFETTMRIRELETKTGGRVPIIGYTAYNFDEGHKRFVLSGMDDWLKKPVEDERLFSIIEKWRPSGQKPSPDVEAQKVLSQMDERRRKRQALVITLIDSMGEAHGEALKALSEGDAGQLEFWSHRMAGALAVFGFDRARDLAREIETLAASSRFEGTGDLLALLGEEVENIKASLKEEA